ncbi:MAG TPA: RiPP maturation radical SAM C-methyltransferase, partial [Blastocatellia bacterium]
FQSGPGAIGEELGIDVPIELDYEPFLNTLESNFPAAKVEPVLSFETSRGCWWGERAHCTFCGLNGMSMAYRAMSPDRARKQFDSLFKFAPKVSQLDAVDNILPKSYIQDVLPLVDTPENMSIFYEVKADLGEQDIQVLAGARVKRIQPGIESLATSTLKLMKKGTSAFQNLTFLKNCLIYGIEPAWNLLIGFPGEGEDVYSKYVQDLPLLVHLPPPSGVFPVRFDRYSPYFVNAGEYGLDLRPLDFYTLIYPFDEEEISELAYYFSDQNINADYVQVLSRWIDPIKERISAWIEPWKREERRPKLCFKDEPNGEVVYDSRKAEVIEHRIGTVGRRILDLMSKRPKRAADVAKGLADCADHDLEKEITSLQQMGLLFQEKDSFISLVVERRE